MRYVTQVEAGAADPFWQLTSLGVEMASKALADTPDHRINDNTLHISMTLRRTTPVLQHILLAPFVGQHRIAFCMSSVPTVLLVVKLLWLSPQIA